MQRPITGFRLDDYGDWAARLSCGHVQHVRHDPPFASRPWVQTAAGRESRLGEDLDCVRCDRFEMPETFVRYAQTPEFTEHDVPSRLRANHSTPAGVWGTIRVIEGQLRYRLGGPDTDITVSPEVPAVIVPEVPHSVEPIGAVRFYVEFWRAPDI
jgi:tellurite methyltransferase